jgi:hypothetical protein
MIDVINKESSNFAIIYIIYIFYKYILSNLNKYIKILKILKTLNITLVQYYKNILLFFGPTV